LIIIAARDWRQSKPEGVVMNMQKIVSYRLQLPETSLTTVLARAWSKARRWYELARQRRQLASLSDEMLKDIGRSRADIEWEASRPFWDDAERQ
jgi:uncharacterized protein YjiS (DUF1127 family)|tara:strand:- start:2630 stop:2911 length:282 start_codon:yes stop_codon:yes gene_type:complete